MKGLFKADGKNYFTVGAQVRNSNSLSEEKMEKNWKAADVIGFNTLAASVHWNQIEKSEGEYDFSQVDMLIRGAQKHGKHLILLWFGAWKNGTSQYIPDWMKIHTERYIRVETVVHQKVMALSPHCAESLGAECKAFESLMRYLKERNQDGVVLGIQVENEAGHLGTPRDYSSLGEKIYRENVPEKVLDWLVRENDLEDPVIKSWKENGRKESGNWQELFGNDGAEFCTAYGFAVYINQVAECGRKIYDFPIYTNVWLGEMYNRVPGIDYPSGGAVSKVLGLWKYLTPSVNAVCPDNYFKDFHSYNEVCGRYARRDNPLYIPETGFSALSAVNVVHAVGAYGLCGVHCFGIEHMLNNDGTIREESREFCHLVHILNEGAPLIEKYQGTDAFYTVTQYEGSGAQYFDFGDFVGRAVFTNPLEDDYAEGQRPYMDADHTDEECYRVRAKGFIIYEGKGSFYVMGEGFRLNLIRKQEIELMTTGVRLSNFQNLRHQEYLELSEGHVSNGETYIADRVRTGDEADYGIWVHYDTGIVHAVLNLD